MIKYVVLLALSFICITSLSQELTEKIDSSTYYKQKAKEYIIKSNSIKKTDPNNALYIDSVWYCYLKSPDDTILYQYNYINIVEQYLIYQNYDSVLVLAYENLLISKKIGRYKYVNKCYTILAQVYSDIEQNDSVIKYCSLNNNLLVYYGRELDELTKRFYLLVGNNLSILANAYANKNEYDISLFLYFKVSDSFINANNENKLGSTYNTIGTIYLKIKDYDNSLIQFKKALEFNKKVKSSYSVTSTYVNIGSLYIYKKQYDTALVYINLAIEGKLKNNFLGKNLARLYNNKGICFTHLGQNDSAMIYFDKSIELFKKVNISFNVIKVRVNIAMAYIEMKEYDKAKKIFLDQIELAKKNNYQNTLMEIYNGLSHIYDVEKDFKKSLYYIKKSYDIQTTIQNVEVKNKMNEYKERYEAELKEKDISKLQKNKELQELEKENQISQKEKQSLISLTLISLSLALLAILFFIRKNAKLLKKSNQEKFIRKEKEKNQKILNIIKNQEVSSINSFIEGQDKERNRIAIELHDRLGSLLSTVKLHFSSFETEIDKEESKNDYNYAIGLLDNSVSEVRSISHNLSQGIITEFGLSKEIENLRDTINSAGKIRIKYIVIGDNVSINTDRLIEIFRIIQEVVTNAIKHSHSDEIFIQQINSEDGINISIEDYGVGFNMDQIENTGMGLANLQNRANKIGAICSIESVLKQGTTVTLDLSKK